MEGGLDMKTASKQQFNIFSIRHCMNSVSYYGNFQALTVNKK